MFSVCTRESHRDIIIGDSKIGVSQDASRWFRKYRDASIIKKTSLWGPWDGVGTLPMLPEASRSQDPDLLPGWVPPPLVLLPPTVPDTI